jgi:hypothetical protein
MVEALVAAYHEALPLVESARKDTMETVYTLFQLKDHWHDYTHTNWYKYLKQGKQYVSINKPSETDGSITSVKMDRASRLVTFPKYLEMIDR